MRSTASVAAVESAVIIESRRHSKRRERGNFTLERETITTNAETTLFCAEELAYVAIGATGLGSGASNVNGCARFVPVGKTLSKRSPKSVSIGWMRGESL
jgi:hypothetical protein